MKPNVFFRTWEFSSPPHNSRKPIRLRRIRLYRRYPGSRRLHSSSKRNLPYAVYLELGSATTWVPISLQYYMSLILTEASISDSPSHHYHDRQTLRLPHRTIVGFYGKHLYCWKFDSTVNQMDAESKPLLNRCQNFIPLP